MNILSMLWCVCVCVFICLWCGKISILIFISYTFIIVDRVNIHDSHFQIIIFLTAMETNLIFIYSMFIVSFFFSNISYSISHNSSLLMILPPTISYILSQFVSINKILFECKKKIAATINKKYLLKRN